MKKVNVKDALTVLDMVHANLFIKLDQLKQSNQKAMLINELHLNSLLLLVEAAMGDLGDPRIKRK